MCEDNMSIGENVNDLLGWEGGGERDEGDWTIKILFKGVVRVYTRYMHENDYKHQSQVRPGRCDRLTWPTFTAVTATAH